MKAHIVLASKSPRRASILRQLGVNFVVFDSSFKEQKTIKNPTPKKMEQLVLKNALGKATDVSKKFREAIIVGVDTLVFAQKEVIGKPKDKKDAMRILKKLNGKSHLIFSGIVLMHKKKKEVKITSSCEVTKVYMRKTSVKAIKEYVLTNEPLDKAGAYGIQEKGAMLIKGVEGDYYNVVGLPIAALLDLAQKAKVELI